MNKNELIKELSQYELTKETSLSKEEANAADKDNHDIYIKEKDMHYYLCELDDLTQTRILFKIFKCVNFIKNVIIAGIALGVLGCIMAIVK